MHVVIDNHRSHMTKIVKQKAKDLNMTLVFQPGYSPEFNSIESLWHVIK
jgi:transposase